MRIATRSMAFGALGALALALVLPLALALALTLSLGGCGKSGGDTPTLPPNELVLPFPDNPDTLIANFAAAYAARNFPAYRQVLHPAYRFVLPLILWESGVPNDFFTRSEELGSAASLFSGQSVEVPEAGTRPGIRKISFTEFHQLAPWTETGSIGPFPNTVHAIFAVDVWFQHFDGTAEVIEGQQEFFASSRDSIVAGATRPYFRLCGQRDLGAKSGVLPTWGSVKAAYYIGPYTPARPDPFPHGFCDNPDTLMARFKSAYCGRDLARYQTILGADYRFQFEPEDVARFNLPSGFYLRADEIACAANIFSGVDLSRDGETLPGITQITLTVFGRRGEWTDTPGDPAFPNSEYAIYDVLLKFYRGPYASILMAQGQQCFFASSRDSTVEGFSRPYYTLSGQRDETTFALGKVENYTWGAMKWLCR